MKKTTVLKNKMNPLAEAISQIFKSNDFKCSEPFIRSVNSYTYIKLEFFNNYYSNSKNYSNVKFRSVFNELQNVLNFKAQLSKENSVIRFSFDTNYMFENYDELYIKMTNFIKSKNSINKFNL